VYKCVGCGYPVFWKVKNVCNALEAIGGFHAAVSPCQVCPISGIVFIAQNEGEPPFAIPGNIDDQKIPLLLLLLLLPSGKSLCHPEPGHIALANVQPVVEAADKLAMIVSAVGEIANEAPVYPLKPRSFFVPDKYDAPVLHELVESTF